MSLIDKITSLSPSLQKKVEVYIDFLRSEKEEVRKTAKPISGKDFVAQFAGSIPKEVVEEMERAIENPLFGCEKVEND